MQCVCAWAEVSTYNDTLQRQVRTDAKGGELAATVAATGAVDVTLLLLLLVADVEALLLAARRNFTRVPSHSGHAGSVLRLLMVAE